MSDATAMAAALAAEWNRAVEAAKEHACAVIDASAEYDQRLCCDGRECGCHGSTVHDQMQHYIRTVALTHPGQPALAALIAAKDAEVERLREALTEIAAEKSMIDVFIDRNGPSQRDCVEVPSPAAVIARAALEPRR